MRLQWLKQCSLPAEKNCFFVKIKIDCCFLLRHLSHEADYRLGNCFTKVNLFELFVGFNFDYIYRWKHTVNFKSYSTANSTFEGDYEVNLRSLSQQLSRVYVKCYQHQWRIEPVTYDRELRAALLGHVAKFCRV